MALWDTFTWSDGTLWADANGSSGRFTAEPERSAYRVSLKFTHTNDTYPGSLASMVIQALSAEVGTRPQLPSNYEAFIDRNENTQRISVRFSHTANQDVVLLTEGESELLLETGDTLLIDPAQPLAVEKIHMLVTPRSRRQPTV
jgi:hypothetical protein